MEKSKLKNTITFTFKKDYRTFKEGQVVELPTSAFKTTYIGGPNGSGKSTLMHFIRAKKHSLEKVYIDMHDGMSSSRLDRLAREMDDVVEVEGLDYYDEIFALDSVIDDPCSVENSITAYGLVSGGGFAMQRASRGQGSSAQIIRFRKMIDKYLTEKYKGEKDNKNILVLLDEIDEGLDMVQQAQWNKIISFFFPLYHIVCISHNPLCLLSEGITKPDVFDINGFKIKTPEEFIGDAINATINITYNGNSKNKETEGGQTASVREDSRE